MDMAKLQRKNVHLLRNPRQVNSHLAIDRPRVTELIETGAYAPLCIVRAPRLNGKTTALQQWAEKTSRQPAWLILDDEQSTVHVFWQQLLQLALAEQGSAQKDRDANVGGTKSTHAVDPSEVPSEDPASAMSAALAGAAPLTVIVTNFHTVQGADFEWDLARLLARTPELSLIVETRSVLEIEKVQFSSGLDAYVVDADDLAFSSAEAAQFHEGPRSLSSVTS
ncbi:hypothetical protein [Arthrobacter sp. N199823]|uniref:hypothetical protein n=1 Tax=Arthrobacter sp. N199823 TaxID=2058895 RepID=UPI000CE3751F|nr:hypothetical protein [Arthrobacter sp. N199823]